MYKNRVNVVKFLTLAFMLFIGLWAFGQGRTVNALELSTVVHNDNKNKATTTESGESNNNDIGNLSISMADDGNGASVTVAGLDSGNTSSTWNTIFKKYKVVILGFSGIATLTFVLLFIKNFISLGACSDNPQARRGAITGCLWTGIATALCGSIMLVVGLFWNGLKD
jgi:hypothetical protein